MAENLVTIAFLLNHESIPKNILTYSAGKYFNQHEQDLRESSLTVCVLTKNKEFIPSRDNAAILCETQWIFITNVAVEQLLEFKLAICEDQHWNSLLFEELQESRSINTFHTPVDQAIFVHLDWNKPHKMSVGFLSESSNINEKSFKHRYENQISFELEKVPEEDNDTELSSPKSNKGENGNDNMHNKDKEERENSFSELNEGEYEQSKNKMCNTKSKTISEDFENENINETIKSKNDDSNGCSNTTSFKEFAVDDTTHSLYKSIGYVSKPIPARKRILLTKIQSILGMQSELDRIKSGSTAAKDKKEKHSKETDQTCLDSQILSPIENDDNSINKNEDFVRHFEEPILTLSDKDNKTINFTTEEGCNVNPNVLYSVNGTFLNESLDEEIIKDANLPSESLEINAENKENQICFDYQNLPYANTIIMDVEEDGVSKDLREAKEYIIQNPKQRSLAKERFICYSREPYLSINDTVEISAKPSFHIISETINEKEKTLLARKDDLSCHDTMNGKNDKDQIVVCINENIFPDKDNIKRISLESDIPNPLKQKNNSITNSTAVVDVERCKMDMSIERKTGSEVDHHLSECNLSNLLDIEDSKTLLFSKDRKSEDEAVDLSHSNNCISYPVSSISVAIQHKVQDFDKSESPVLINTILNIQAPLDKGIASHSENCIYENSYEEQSLKIKANETCFHRLGLNDNQQEIENLDSSFTNANLFQDSESINLELKLSSDKINSNNDICFNKSKETFITQQSLKIDPDVCETCVFESDPSQFSTVEFCLLNQENDVLFNERIVKDDMHIDNGINLIMERNEVCNMETNDNNQNTFETRKCIGNANENVFSSEIQPESCEDKLIEVNDTKFGSINFKDDINNKDQCTRDHRKFLEINVSNGDENFSEKITESGDILMDDGQGAMKKDDETLKLQEETSKKNESETVKECQETNKYYDENKSEENNTKMDMKSQQQHENLVKYKRPNTMSINLAHDSKANCTDIKVPEVNEENLLHINDDSKYPDSVTPTKVEPGLSKLAKYDVPYMDDDMFYNGKWYSESNKRWTSLNTPKGLENSDYLMSIPVITNPQKTLPKASIETLTEIEVGRVKISMKSVTPGRKRKGIMNLCSCIGGRKKV